MVKHFNLTRLLPFTVDEFHAAVVVGDFTHRFLVSRDASEISIGEWRAKATGGDGDSSSQRKCTCRMPVPRLDKELGQALQQARSVQVTMLQTVSFDRGAMCLQFDEAAAPTLPLTTLGNPFPRFLPLFASVRLGAARK